MFERFTDGAGKVATGAQASARRLGHECIGTEHILLALLEGDGVAAEVLAGLGVTKAGVERELLAVRRQDRLSRGDAEALGAIGIDLEEVRRRLEASFGPGALQWKPSRHCRSLPIPGHIPFSPRAKKVMELSLREAVRLKHRHIDTEHILLGLVREGEGLAMLILVRLGVGPDAIRARVTDALRSTG
jgi:ATP-dependent Clp protease ATP-binding subunit ClpA